jgi:hypothetical protein
MDLRISVYGDKLTLPQHRHHGLNQRPRRIEAEVAAGSAG